MTINVWPSGCVCHAVRAPGSNMTLAPRTRAGSGASNSGSMRTLPVNQSAGPLPDGCEPGLFISIFSTSFFRTCSQLRKGAWLRRSFTLSTINFPRPLHLFSSWASWSLWWKLVRRRFDVGFMKTNKIDISATENHEGIARRFSRRNAMTAKTV